MEQSVNMCIKRSYLWQSGVIKSHHLTINERIRRKVTSMKATLTNDEDVKRYEQDAKEYANYLLHVGLGLLRVNDTHVNHFKNHSPMDDYLEIPKNFNIVHDYNNMEQFVNDVLHDVNKQVVPETTILAPTNRMVTNTFLI